MREREQFQREQTFFVVGLKIAKNKLGCSSLDPLKGLYALRRLGLQTEEQKVNCDQTQVQCFLYLWGTSG